MNTVVRTIQLIEIDALKEFQKICDENSIHFFLRGGSVLGAVKYKGFIPWDDDMDVAVPREDYEKLIQLFQNKPIAGKYYINSYRYCKELHCYFPRMVLSEDERIKNGLPKNTNLGLHLMDIFPIDGAPNSLLGRLSFYLKIYILRTLASLGTVYTGEMVNMHTRKQQFVIDVIRCLNINRLINQKKVYMKLEKLYTKYDWKTQKYAGTPTASLFTREIMPQEYWGKGVLMDFDELKVMVPEKYDSYLKRMYGKNYLYEEPEEKDRKSHLKGNK